MDKITAAVLALFAVAVCFGVYFVIAHPTGTSEITWPVLIGAGIIDSINPCAIAVMIMLMGFLSTQKDIKKMLLIGSVYTVVVYITYLLAGLGLLAGIQGLGIAPIVYKIAAVLAIGFGIINLKDFFFPHQGFVLEIPNKFKPKVKELIQNVSVPGAFLLGFFVSLVELPCSGTIYFAILGMLGTSQFTQALIYLMIYNLFFVLPLVLIMLLMVKGITAKEALDVKESSYRYIRLAMGLLLIFLGIAMLFNLI